MITKDRIKASSSRLDSNNKPDILDWTNEQRYLSGQTLTQAQPITDNTVFNVFQFTKCKQILFSAVFADKYSCQWSYSKNNIYLIKHFIFKPVSFFIHFLCLCLTSSHHYDAAFPPNLHGDGLLFDPSVPIATLPSLYLGNVLFLRGVARITFVIVQIGESVIIYSVLYRWGKKLLGGKGGDWEVK